MSGYFSERPSTGRHDPLQAKAIVWPGGGEMLVASAVRLLKQFKR